MPTIREILNKSKTTGDVGIEIEVEADKRLPHEGLPELWRAEADNSLRGHSMEYITEGPVSVCQVEGLVNSLKKVVMPSKPKYSFRAGVHVHVNAQELTPFQVGTMATVYWCLEEALTKFCGENREGNHFCLRLKDAQYPLTQILNALSTGDLYHLDTDNLRYSGMNLRALCIYGSVEFRAMETTPDFSKIKDWAQILVAIRQYAVGINNRSEIAYQMSATGPENWAREVLGDDLFELINYQNFEQDVMSCMRLVQPLIYNRDAS